MKNEKIYLLMLVYVNEDCEDIAANQYPLKGFIQAKHFSIDKDIQYGLVGIPWGQRNSFIYEKKKNGHWLVVKTEVHNNLICIDRIANRYKFREGVVLHSGKINTCAKFIWKKINEDNNEFLEESKGIQLADIAGSKEWRNNNLISYL